eukprot:243565-Chlamydomonas_euryale.AAC.1
MPLWITCPHAPTLTPACLPPLRLPSTRSPALSFSKGVMPGIAAAAAHPAGAAGVTSAAAAAAAGAHPSAAAASVMKRRAMPLLMVLLGRGSGPVAAAVVPALLDAQLLFQGDAKLVEQVNVVFDGVLEDGPFEAAAAVLAAGAALAGVHTPAATA